MGKGKERYEVFDKFGNKHVFTNIDSYQGFLKHNVELFIDDEPTECVGMCTSAPVSPYTPNQEMFFDIAMRIAQKLAQKNHDYGDSFHKVYKDFSDLSTFIRLSDKMGRLETAVSGMEFQVEDETIEDIYWDMAGYCILTLASKNRLKQEEQKHAMACH